jgi:hypothetical protein
MATVTICPLAALFKARLAKYCTESALTLTKPRWGDFDSLLHTSLAHRIRASNPALPRPPAPPDRAAALDLALGLELRGPPRRLLCPSIGSPPSSPSALASAALSTPLPPPALPRSRPRARHSLFSLRKEYLFADGHHHHRNAGREGGCPAASGPSQAHHQRRAQVRLPAGTRAGPRGDQGPGGPGDAHL